MDCGTEDDPEVDPSRARVLDLETDDAAEGSLTVCVSRMLLQLAHPRKLNCGRASD